jgi:hypothetical protein
MCFYVYGVYSAKQDRHLLRLVCTAEYLIISSQASIDFFRIFPFNDYTFLKTNQMIKEKSRLH